MFLWLYNTCKISYMNGLMRRIPWEVFFFVAFLPILRVFVFYCNIYARVCSHCQFPSVGPWGKCTCKRCVNIDPPCVTVNTTGSRLITAIEVGKALVSSSHTACFYFILPLSHPPSSIAHIAGIPVEQTLICCFRAPHQQQQQLSWTGSTLLLEKQKDSVNMFFKIALWTDMWCVCVCVCLGISGGNFYLQGEIQTEIYSLQPGTLRGRGVA